MDEPRENCVSRRSAILFAVLALWALAALVRGRTAAEPAAEPAAKPEEAGEESEKGAVKKHRVP